MNSCVRYEDRDSLMEVLPFSHSVVSLLIEERIIADPPQSLYFDGVRGYKFNKSRGSLIAALKTGTRSMSDDKGTRSLKR